MFKKITLILTVIFFSLFAQVAGQHVDYKTALKTLMDGNERFVAAQATHPHQTLDRRQELSKGQHPIAVVLSCSDSRVPPELLFDQGLGDIFIIRTAGNVVDDIGLGSIEYAIEHLNVSLIVVLGHESCGAVTAAVKGGHATGHINSIVEAIHPVVEKTKDKSGDVVNNCVIANVKNVVDQLNNCEPILKEFVHEGKLKIIGARYDLDEGKVTLVE